MKKKKNPYIVPIIIAVIIVLVIFAKDITNLFQSEFEKNLDELGKVNEKYNTNLYTFPLFIEDDILLLEDLKELKNIEAPESFKLFLDIRLKLVESDLFFKEGWKHGRGSTTKWGFGCRKGLARLRNATFNRNMSSQIGYEAVALIHEIVEKYPKEAEIANVTIKNALFLNASFYQEEKDARRDRAIVESGCVKDENE